jgi:hypothetical protein
MRRREFITLVGGATATWPLAARAQQPAKVARIGYLDLGPASARASRVEALRAGLRDLGYVEGKNIVIVFRWADGVQSVGTAEASAASRSMAASGIWPHRLDACAMFRVGELRTWPASIAGWLGATGPTADICGNYPAVHRRPRRPIMC